MRPADQLTTADLSAVARGVGFSVRSVRRIGSGQSATTEELESLEDARRIVVRRHGSWAAEHDPEVASREAAVIGAVRRAGVPAPEVLWSGIVADRPVLVTELMPGTVILEPGDPVRWTRELVGVLGAIHSVALDEHPRSLLEAASPGPVEAVDEKTVLGHPRGRDLLETRRALRPGRPVLQTLVHGDYHPGNLLWQSGIISAVLDWEAARIGDPACDVAYCCNELRLLGRDDLARAFRAGYRQLSGRTVDSFPYWAATALCRSVGELDSIVASWAACTVNMQLEAVQRRCDRMIDELLTGY